MARGKLPIALVAAVLLLGAIPAFAQMTATLTGTVTSDGTPLPGATITITSSSLQGVRTTLSGDNGDYVFQAIPPGKYTVTVELEGLQTVKQTANVRLGETARADADLKMTKVAEAITVTAAASSVLETSQVSTSLTRDQIEALPIGRTIAQRIQLAPGVNNAGVNNQTVVNGAPSYDNLYLVNGVVVNDTLRGQPENLFIEDAIQETSLITAAVSAEYGRFTGGVVNTITRSGGNEFTGSLRDNITNPSWTKVTDFVDPVSGKPQPANASVRSNQWEATLGGYVIKDRLWFFGAGRKFNEETANVTTATNIPYVNTRDNKRYEAKLTGQITEKHSLIASYLNNKTQETNNRYGSVVDLRSLTNRELPNWLQSYHYTGILTNSFLVEGLYSRRYFAFVGGGGPTDLINGTLLRDNSTSRRMWSPTFCGECMPKVRNNKDYEVKANYFISTKATGSHTIVAGYDQFADLRKENNYQSGSNYRIWGDFVYDGTNAYFHADPKNGYVTWNPILELSKTSKIETQSAFVNDKWDFNAHFSFNVGLRLDKNNALDQSHKKVADDSTLSPRLSAIYDVNGTGRDRISASYAKYAAKLDAGIADTVALGGQPGSVYFNYRGPEINAFDPKTGKLLGTPVPTDQVIQQVFAWFNSVGGPTGYKDISSIFMPGLTERLERPLKSPSMNEYSVGYGHQLGTSGFVRADVIHRDWKDFYVTVRDTTTGKATSAAGTPVDVGLIENSNSGLSRKYNGVQLQGAYRIKRLNFGANYTYAKLRGNVEGETWNNATVTVGNLQYPEFRNFDRNQPVGYLDEDIRHRANLYANYDFPLPFGTLNLGMMERYHSGSPYAAWASIDPRKPAVFGVDNATLHYATPPDGGTSSPVNYYFSDRGAYRVDSISATDLTAQLLFRTIGRVNLFIRGDLINVFNQQGVEYVATALGNVIETRVYTARQKAKTTDGKAALVGFNPWQQTPVQYIPGSSDPNGTYNYQLDPNFGKPTNKDAYQQPRTYRFAVGVRF